MTLVPMMPAPFIAGAWINRFQAGIEIVSKIIGPELRGGDADAPPRAANYGWIAILCLTAASALLLVVAAQGAGRRGDAMAPLIFWSGVVLLVLPTSLRIAWPLVARSERLLLLLLLAEALFYCKVVYSPTSFAHFDEFLHWIASEDLITARRLFLSNPLHAVGPVYPALEILTTAIVQLTGLPLFVAGSLLLAVLKGTYVCALFLFYEKITGSPRISAIGCLVNMGCQTFVIFESMFSYESLGIVLCVLILAAEAASRDLAGRPRLKALGLTAVLLACLAVTHHLSAAFAAIYLGALAALEVLPRANIMRTGSAMAASVLAILAITVPLLWLHARGDLVTNYLGPVVETGFKTLHGMVVHSAPAGLERVGPPAVPIGMRLATLLGLLLLAVGLCTGFFRSLAMAAPSCARAGWPLIQDILKGRWRDSRIVLLTMLTLVFPVSIALRLTMGGWEIGNRMGTFVFIGVGLVVAVSIVHFWQGRMPCGWRRIGPAVSLAAIVMGGVASAFLDPIRGRYKPGADSQSIELMGIQTALWTKERLGAGNRFTADRVNSVLLASYGRQNVRPKIVQGIDTWRVFKAEKLSADDFYALSNSDIDFLLVDRRLSMSPPVLGIYFAPWEGEKGMALSSAALLKFNHIEGITRTYDNGWIVIYDLRGLHGQL
jgi:hypothetical protein